jgi:hypothetical protein
MSGQAGKCRGHQTGQKPRQEDERQASTGKAHGRNPDKGLKSESKPKGPFTTGGQSKEAKMNRLLTKSHGYATACQRVPDMQ